MKIVYWSGTGNTEKMANLIASGMEEKGVSVDVVNVANADANIFEGEDIVILGCPSMGDEVLEETEFEPFIEDIKEKVSNKKVALFGSYGWGSGQWMEDWEERMISYGCISPLDTFIVNNEPEGETEELCIEFGRKITTLLNG